MLKSAAERSRSWAMYLSLSVKVSMVGHGLQTEGWRTLDFDGWRVATCLHYAAEEDGDVAVPV